MSTDDASPNEKKLRRFEQACLDVRDEIGAKAFRACADEMKAAREEIARLKDERDKARQNFTALKLAFEQLDGTCTTALSNNAALKAEVKSLSELLGKYAVERGQLEGTTIVAANYLAELREVWALVEMYTMPQNDLVIALRTKYGRDA
jgi:chromosome segregation ATPase